MKTIIFVVEMLRNGSREEHSYIAGVYSDETKALHEAWEHINMRAGKYGAEVHGYKVDTAKRVYFQKLDEWEGFANSCKETAAKIRAMINKEEKDET